ncbi:MAG: glycine/betaine/sarcosine/D-proline family reductase selenoprotein B [Chloroflexi bacterium]|nr:glycine/betaine/sarcosine/D-proline family reductase selenoprotein B [Chloroflexota bacterium]
MAGVKVAHYINQFFGGVGGEEKADAPLEVREGPLGPGRALQAAFGERGEVVATLVCGDGYFAEHEGEVSEQARCLLANIRPDVVVAGPAFNAGRYALACGRMCQVAQEKVGVPAVTAMYPENPGAASSRAGVYVIPTAASAVGMGDAIQRLADFAVKLASGQALGPAADEGYLPRGIRHNVFAGKAASERAIEMLLAKHWARPFVTELKLEVMDTVSPAPPIADLASATIAIVTESGVVLKGNPDRIESVRATRWARYDIAGIADLSGEEFMTIHGGYNIQWVNQDPDRAVPVDALRQLEAAGVIGRLLNHFYATCGNGGDLSVMAKMAQEMAAELRAQGVGGVVLPAT